MLPGGGSGNQKIAESEYRSSPVRFDFFMLWLTALAELTVGRLGKPEEIAETVMWMVNTGYVTRKIIAVDGGYHPY